MKKKSVILLVLAVLSLIGSFELLPNVESFLIGLVITAAFAWFGLKPMVAAKKEKKTVQSSTSSVKTSTASPVTPPAPVTPSVAAPQTVAHPVSLPTLAGKTMKYHYDDVFIAGSSHHDTSGAVVGAPLHLVPEPTNEYDSKAVAIMQNNVKLGYMAKDNRLRDMFFDFAARGDVVLAVLESKDDQKLTMKLGFYIAQPDSIEAFEAQGIKGKTYRLTGNRNEESQDAIGVASVGDEINVTYDFEKEKYDADGLGFFPKAAEELLEGDYTAFVSDISADDEGRYAVKAIIFPR